MRYVRWSVIVGMTIGWLLAFSSARSESESLEPSAQQRRANHRVFKMAWKLVDKKIYDPTFGGKNWKDIGATYQQAAYGSKDFQSLYVVINRMLGELSVSHLVAMSKPVVTNSQRGTLGLVMMKTDGGTVVVSVVPGGPAAMAGVKPGWLQLEPPRSSEGTNDGTVHLVFADENNDRHELDVKRTTTLRGMPSLTDAKVLPENVLYLHFDAFTEETASWCINQIRAREQSQSIIFDLRGNRGGSTKALEQLLGDILGADRVIGSNISRHGSTPKKTINPHVNSYNDGPMVVLVDQSSMSSAEVFAHSLQYYKRATIVGQRTAGAVLSSQEFPLPFGGRISIPIYDYVGIDGRRIERNGVAPDVVVPSPSVADLRALKDVFIDAAIGYLHR